MVPMNGPGPAPDAAFSSFTAAHKASRVDAGAFAITAPAPHKAAAEARIERRVIAALYRHRVQCGKRAPFAFCNEFLVFP